VVVLGLAWRTVRFAVRFPLWGDEAFLAINLVHRGLGELAQPLEFGQVAPPGFLWAVWTAIRALGTTEWSLRMVSFGAGVASLLLFWAFCRRVAIPRVALLAVAIFAASVYPVRHAAEVKPYALDLFVSLVVLVIGWAVRQSPRSLGLRAALVAAAVVGVWISYTAIFPVAGVGLFLAGWAWRRRNGRLFGFALAFGLLAGASWLTMLLGFARSQLQETSWLVNLTTWRDAFPPLDRPCRLPWWLLTVHTGNMLAYPYGANAFGSTLTALLVARGAAALWRTRRELLLLLLSPMAMGLVAAALRRYPYGTSARVTLYLAPTFCLLAAEGLAALIATRLRRRDPDHVALRLAGLLALIPLAGMVVDPARPYKGADDLVNRQMARTVAAALAPGDRILAYNGTSPPPTWPDLMLQVWLQQAAEFRFYLDLYAPAPVHWANIPPALDGAPGARTVLVIHRPGWDPFPAAELDAYLAALVARLGRPRSTLYPLGPYEDIEVCVFPFPERVGPTPFRLSSRLGRSPWPEGSRAY
jgi:hypothetical protein